LRAYNLLNLLRWLGAFFVVIGHLRSFIFVNYHSVDAHTIFTNFFYFVTGFGHQGVIIFFVISGYLVGGKMLDKYMDDGLLDSDFIKLYCIKRFSRIYTVLIPAIFVGLFFDLWGVYLFKDLYENFYHISSMDVNVANNINAANFLGNILNLQTITSEPLGTNLPTWSLANEWWYYILFPLLLANKYSKILFFLIVACFIFLNLSLLEYSLLWLIGTIIYQVNVKFTTTSLSVFLFLCTLIASRMIHGFYIDFILAISVAMLINTVSHADKKLDLFVRSNKFLANFSYSLYLFHFPFIVLLISIFHVNQIDIVLLYPGFSAFGIYLFILAFVYAFSFVMYLLFEKNTNKVKKILIKKIIG
jgi:peptidoglycan/LPS O-acetylase OafA/YrhL